MTPNTLYSGQRKLVLSLVVAMLIAAAMWIAHGQTQAQSAVNAALPSVVRIIAVNCTAGCRPEAVGSGAIIHPSGIILTAWHVVVEDDDDPFSRHHSDFIIEVTNSAREQVQARYRAQVVASASAPEVDLAVLRIYYDELRKESIELGTDLGLPSLPIGDSARLIELGIPLDILGFPSLAGKTINLRNAEVSGYEERMIRINEILGEGNSGGPALAEQDGKLAIVGVVIRDRQNQNREREFSLLREINSLDRLLWVRNAQRGWLSETEVTAQGTQLTVNATANALDLENGTLRLLAYLLDARTGAPWQGAAPAANLIVTEGGQAVLFADIDSDDFVSQQSVRISVDLDQLGATPDHLRVHLVLWDGKAGRALWQSARPLSVSQSVAIAPTARSTPIPPTTNTPIQPPTSTNTSMPTAAPTATNAPTFTATPTATPAPPTATSTPTPSEPQAGATRVVEGITFVYVPAGEFMMGSTEEEIDAAFEQCQQYRGDACQRSWYADEAPTHTVYLDGYWIGQTEVTNAQFRAFMEAGGYTTERYWSEDGWAWRVENQITEPAWWQDSNYNGDQQPVVGISWYESDAYSRWLAQSSGLPIRLPTEAEWEKAARGPESRIYPWGDAWDPSRANYCDKRCGETFVDATWADVENDDGYARTSPVGSFPFGASPYGALDMAGNVLEWTGDWYASDYYASSPTRSPTGPDVGSFRVLRGGSWGGYPTNVRGAARHGNTPLDRLNDVGVRVVLVPGF